MIRKGAMSQLDSSQHAQFHRDILDIPESPAAHVRDPHVLAKQLIREHVCPPEPVQTMASSISENVELRCQACGQGMRVMLTDTYNNDQIKFCPICGTPTLARDHALVSKREAGHTYFKTSAACFAGINPALVALLYQGWRYEDAKDDPEIIQPARFVDYLKAQLEENI